MRPVVLSGFMGTGKSTVGPRLATKLGVPFVDTDEVIAREAGASVPELWKRDGEAAFRARERDLVTRLLGEPAPQVIAFGGGAVTQRVVRHLALDRATVITLTASAKTILARTPDVAARPNLGVVTGARSDDGSPDLATLRLVRIEDLLAQRAHAYAECLAQVQTDDADPDEVVSRLVGLTSPERDTVVMPLGERSYVIDLGCGMPDRVAEVVAAAAPSHVIVVTDENVARARPGALAAATPVGCRRTTISLPPGERNKTLNTVSSIWDAALLAGIDRKALVLALGGGVVGDLAGFAASALLRGVRFIQVPTTLLAMVDSSVGGKTGFDHAAGKNLVGAFHQPHAVVIDLDHLSTLPARERTAGLAEIVKIALVADADLLEALEANASALAAGDAEALAPVVRQAVVAKVRIVRDDEREQGARALLNLGHTVGHALEAHGDYGAYLHGEAIAIGTVTELRMAVRLGHTPPSLEQRARSLLQRLGLPTEPQPGELAASWRFIAADKKRDAAAIRWPIVSRAGDAHIHRIAIEAARKVLESEE